MNPLDWSLTDGALPTVLLVAAVVALVLLIGGRGRGWWARIPLVAVVAALAALLVRTAVDDWWKPFPDPLPMSVIWWIGLGFFALGLALARVTIPRTPWKRRLGALAAAALVVLAALSQVNVFYREYPTMRAALGPWIGRTVTLKTDASSVPVVAAPPGHKLSEIWRPPANMPTKGQISEVTIPGTVSGFNARSGYVYLPPAYLASPRAELPVLILLAGQPGDARNWIDSGGLPGMMDSFAAGHKGLAPVVVMPDDLGGPFDNPLCVDSKLGNVETYLTKDVPDWIAGKLRVSRAMAVGGLSHGGTCSIQLAVRAPQLFPTFVDIAGQREPTLGTRKETVDKAFGGDEAAFRRINPLDILATRRFPDSAGVFVAGEGDHTYTAQQRVVFAAAQQAGMKVTWMELPGGHSWQVWKPGLEKNLPWLADRLGLS